MLEIGAMMMQSTAVDAAIATVVSYATLIGLIGKLTTAFSQKTVEQQKDLQTVAQVITTLSPEAKKLLEDNKKQLEYWQEKANIATQQLNVLLPMIPKEAQANSMTNLPRENKETLQTTNT